MFWTAVKTDRLGPRERGDAPDPRETAKRTRQFAREQHLHDHVATLPVEFFRNANAMKSGFGELVPQGEGIIVLVLLQVARPFLGHLIIDPAANHIPEGTVFLG